MSINIHRDPLQKAYLFGTAVLYSEKPIPREDVPQYWYCYELRGTMLEPDKPYALVDLAMEHCTGSILSPLPLKKETAQSRLVKGKFELTSEYVRLAEFCSEYQISQPQTPIWHMFRPASSTESGLFMPCRLRRMRNWGLSVMCGSTSDIKAGSSGTPGGRGVPRS